MFVQINILIKKISVLKARILISIFVFTVGVTDLSVYDKCIGNTVKEKATKYK